MTTPVPDPHPRRSTNPTPPPVPTPAPAWLLFPFAFSTVWSFALVGAVTIGYDPMSAPTIAFIAVVSFILMRGRRRSAPEFNPHRRNHVR